MSSVLGVGLWVNGLEAIGLTLVLNDGGNGIVEEDVGNGHHLLGKKALSDLVVLPFEGQGVVAAQPPSDTTSQRLPKACLRNRLCLRGLIDPDRRAAEKTSMGSRVISLIQESG